MRTSHMLSTMITIQRSEREKLPSKIIQSVCRDIHDKNFQQKSFKVSNTCYLISFVIASLTYKVCLFVTQIMNHFVAWC